MSLHRTPILPSLLYFTLWIFFSPRVWQNAHLWGIAQIPRGFQNDWSNEYLDSAPFRQWVGDAAGPTVVAIVDVAAYRFVLGTLCPRNAICKCGLIISYRAGIPSSSWRGSCSCSPDPGDVRGTVVSPCAVYLGGNSYRYIDQPLLHQGTTLGVPFIVGS